MLGRADQALVTNPITGQREIVAILYGDHDGSHGERTYVYPARARVEGRIIHPGTGEAHPILWSGPGATVAISMRWARIVVGVIS